MNAGAITPEELETLFEDAFVVRDRAEVRALFDDHAVVATERTEARGGEAIGLAVAELWARDHTYVAGTRRVLQARGTALVVADAGIHVVRRRGDGTWRSTISLLHLETPNPREDA
jgi:hypothetical protein